MPAPSWAEIEETLGERISQKLLHHFRGVSVWFPLKLSDAHQLVTSLGREDAEAACEVLRGNTITIPTRRPRKNLRSDVIRIFSEGGNSRAIARQLGITQRYVERILAERVPKPSLSRPNASA